MSAELERPWPPPDPENNEAARREPAASVNQLLGSNQSTAKRPGAQEPEHRNDRRRFLIWALMIGAVPPQRVTERVLAEVEAEAAR